MLRHCCVSHKMQDTSDVGFLEPLWNLGTSEALYSHKPRHTQLLAGKER